MDNQANTKAEIAVAPADWHEVDRESLWLSPAGEGLFRVENIPVYATNLAYQDLVTVAQGNSGPEIAELVERGGHSTYRLMLLPGRSLADFQAIWPRIEALGCSYESKPGQEDIFAVTVPPEASVEEVYSIFEEGMQDDIWDFEEAYYFPRL